MSIEERQLQPTADEARTSVLLEISNAMVRLYKEQFGRGPTKARTYWGGPDTLMVVLEDTLAPVERSMVDMGEHHRLRELRMLFSVRHGKRLLRADRAHHRAQGPLVCQRHRHRGRRTVHRSLRVASAWLRRPLTDRARPWPLIGPRGVYSRVIARDEAGPLAKAHWTGPACPGLSSVCEERGPRGAALSVDPIRPGPSAAGSRSADSLGEAVLGGLPARLVEHAEPLVRLVLDLSVRGAAGLAQLDDHRARVSDVSGE
jgi:Na+-translocating membrane potential-generating system MpsC-like protein